MRIILSVFTILLLPSILFSQQRALTIEEAIQIGLANSKTLRISKASVEAAEAKFSETRAERLPTMKLLGGYTRLSEVDPFRVIVPFSPTPITLSPIVLNNYNLRATLLQPVFTGLRLHHQARSAAYTAEATLEEYEMDKTEFIYAVKSMYWELYKTVEEKSVIEENVERMKLHLSDVENFQKQGLVTTNDVLKVKVQLSSAQLLQIDAKNAVEIARITLNMLLGQPLDTDISIASPIAHESRILPRLQELVAKALADRSDLRGLDLRVKATKELVGAASSGWFPQVTLVGNYHHGRPNPRILPTQDRFVDTWDIGVTFQWDFWNWGATAAHVNQAEAQLSQATLAYEQRKDAVVLEVTRNYLDLQRAKEKLTVAEKGKEQGEENYRVTQERFRQGLVTISELLDAEVAALQAKTSYTKALVDLELAQAKLEVSLGGL